MTLNNPGTLQNAENYLASKKQKIKETNLPGFTENKVDPEVKSRLDKQNKHYLAIDLIGQQRDTQMKLQLEDLENKAYSQQVKRQVNQSEKSQRNYDQ